MYAPYIIGACVALVLILTIGLAANKPSTPQWRCADPTHTDVGISGKRVCVPKALPARP